MGRTHPGDSRGRRAAGRRPFVVLAGLALAGSAAGPSPAATLAPVVVSLVRSDDPALPEPVAPDRALDYARHLRPMVHRAVEQAGLRERVESALPGADGVVDVVCKVNIVHAAHVRGDVTDWRVVKAVLEAVHQWAPAARLTVAEGGVWFPPERIDFIARAPDVEVGDGFATAGYRALLRDPDLAGAGLRLVDLNYDDAVQVEPPGGGLVAETYWVPRTILDAEVLISLPVLKVTGAVGMTVAAKNLIGIAPGLKYGWSKAEGWPPGSGNPGLWHSARTLDETIVDLAGVAGVDFAVVDAIVGMERARIAADGGRPVRLNTVIAGADLLAVDAVAARLMGMNPADMEFLQLGQRRGLGVGNLEQIDVRGDLERLAVRFEKHPADWGVNGEYGHYGMGNRTWLLYGPIPADQANVAIDPQAPQAPPTPGQGGWTAPVYFHDDKIDLDAYFDGPTHCVVYAFAQFDAPREQAAELWVGSDEGLRVWLDGEAVYGYQGRRTHRLPNDRAAVRLTAGRHRILVEAGQRRGDFDFSLKLCEPEADPRYDGNAVAGLAWHVPDPTVAEVRVLGDDRGRRQEWFEASAVDLTEPRRVRLDAYLPWDGSAPWVALEWPRKWGYLMELDARIGDRRLAVTTANVAAFQLVTAGALAEPSAPLDLEVDGQRLGDVQPGRWRLAASDRGAWSMAPADPIDWEAKGRVARAIETLDRGAAPGLGDSRLGNWYCDAIRFATGADVAFQNAGGMRADLEAGGISIDDLFRLNFPDRLYIFRLTGAQLLAALEHALGDGGDGPLQVSGMSYAFDRSRPPGQRIVDCDLDPARSYTVAAEDYLCVRGERFFGRQVEWRDTGEHIVDALVRYAARQGAVTAPPVGRIRQLGRP